MIKDNLIIFEEKVPYSELTEREKQAYGRGYEEGINKFHPIYYLLFTFVAVLFFAIGGLVASVFPEFFK